MSAAVESFARHASRYGDPAGVLETAAREFPPAELGALVARLRRVPRARDKKNKLWKPTGSQARMLTVAMLDAGVPATTISKRLGRDVSWVREVEAVLGHPTLEPLRRRRNNCRHKWLRAVLAKQDKGAYDQLVQAHRDLLRDRGDASADPEPAPIRTGPHVDDFGFGHDKNSVACRDCGAGGHWAKWPQWRRIEHFERRHAGKLTERHDQGEPNPWSPLKPTAPAAPAGPRRSVDPRSLTLGVRLADETRAWLIAGRLPEADGLSETTTSPLPGDGSRFDESGRDRLSTSGVASTFSPAQTLPPNLIVPGMQFGQLTVVEAGRDHTNRKYIHCTCTCGEETRAKPSHLLRGEKQSCGCLRRERLKAMKRGVVGVAS